MKYKQTDFIEDKNLFNYGCYFMNLLAIASRYTGNTLTKKAVLAIKAECVKNGAMRNDGKYKMWIMDDAKVINTALGYVGARRYIVKRCGTNFYPAYFKKYPAQVDYRVEGMSGEISGYCIEQRDAGRFSHFLQQDYDPWYTESGYLHLGGLLSQRFFSIREE